MKFLSAGFCFSLSFFIAATVYAATATQPNLSGTPTLRAPEAYDPTKPTADNPAPAVAPTSLESSAKLLLDGAVAKKGRALLWEVKSKSNVIYLYGTIHVGKSTFYPLPSQVEAALKLSKRLVVEADISNTDGAAEIDTIISYKPPDVLDKHISAPLFARLQTQLVRLKIPLAAVKTMKPFLIAGFLSIAEFSKLGYDMNFGVDGYLIGKAKEADKIVLELESQAGQLKMLDGMSPPLQEAFLDNAISALEAGNASEQVTGMVNAWQAGDAKLMQEVSTAVNKNMRMTDQLDEILLHGRHDAMLKKIEFYLQESVPHFVAVGSLHLVGTRGLVEMLRSRGYELKQL